MKHSLTNKDKAALTADCSVCGPAVPIRLNGRYGIVCLEARREKARRYKQAHPERVRQQKLAASPSPHRLDLRTGEADTCAVCGPVQPKAWGRGWICPTVISEKGWKVTQVAPQPKCSTCATYLDRFGVCARCAADQVSWMPTEARAKKRHLEMVQPYVDAGFTIADFETQLPAEESAVTGWKTLGDGPALSADHWMRKNGHSW
jgi:hypothetical protein